MELVEWFEQRDDVTRDEEWVASATKSGRDYYWEVSGIPDVTLYETLPARAHVLVPKGKKLY